MNNVNVIGVVGLIALVGLVPPAPPAPPASPPSPLADAAMRGDIETMRTLLREGADVNAAQGDGMTALHWASMRNDVAMTEMLIYAGANVEPMTRLGRYTPLHLASREGLTDVVGALLEAGSSVNTVTSTGVTAIHFAAQADAPDAIRILLEHGADVNAADARSGRTPLMFATARNGLDAIESLLHAGADIRLTTNVVDYRAQAEADNAERRRRARMAAAARPRIRRDSSTTPPDSSATPPDSSAAPRDSLQASPDSSKASPDSSAAAPDSLARRPDSAQAVRDSSVVPKQSPEEPDSVTHAGTTRAARPDSQPKRLSYTDLVGEQGGLTALHYAAREGYRGVVHLLLEAGADINQLTEGDQSSPLLVAVINGNYDLAMDMLERGADPDLVSEDGAGPLFATINIEWSLRTWYPQPQAFRQQNTTYLELMEALLKAGADPNVRLKQHVWYAAYNAGRMGVDFAGATPIWRAAYATDVAAMRLLAAHGADPNIRTTKPAPRRPYRPDSASVYFDSTEVDKSGLPPVPVGGPAVHPLHAASGVGYGTSRVGQQHRHVPDGWHPAVRYLVEELGVDVNLRDHDGYSALHHAASRGDNETIEFLVEQGADVTFVSRKGQTTVDMANGPQQRVQPFPETIALLEGFGAKNNNKCLSCE